MSLSTLNNATGGGNNNGSGSSSYLLDPYFSFQATKSFMDAKWSWETLAKWLMVASMDSIKQMIQLLVKYLQNKLSTTDWSNVLPSIGWKLLSFFTLILRIRRNIVNKLFNKKCKEESNEGENNKEENTTLLIINKIKTFNFIFKPDQSFFSSLYNKILESDKTSNQIITYDLENIYNVKQNNVLTYNITEIWHNIIIKNSIFSIYFNNPIVMNFEITNNSKRFISSSYESDNNTVEDIDTDYKNYKLMVTNIKDNDQLGIWGFIPYKKFRTEIINYSKNIDEELVKIFNNYNNCMFNNKVVLPFINNADFNYKSYDRLRNDMYILLYMLYTTKYYKQNINYSKVKPLWFFNLMDEIFKNAIQNFGWKFIIDIKFSKLEAITDFKKVCDYLYSKIFHDNDLLTGSNQINQREREKEGDNATISLTLETENDTLTPIEIWQKFILDLQSYNQKISPNTAKKVKTFLLKINREKIEEKTSNEEYNVYLEKKKIVEQILDKKDQNIPTTELYEFLRQEAPSKFLVTEKIVKSVNVEEINEISKDLSTVYLRKEDIKTLENALYYFKEKKDLLQTLGLPNKLGILLYGEPGTGKTSTIYGIASYLGKNIYYISLNGVKTNDELKMLFEHVIKKSSDNGIIVMEDIDAMCPIVLKRNRVNDTNLPVTNLFNNEKTELTLEYFLNLLQGALTMDNTMFIATTNHIENLDPAFYRDGRFDLKIELKACDHYQINTIYKKFLDKEIDKNVLKLIPEYKFTPATIIFRIVKYMLYKDTDDKIILEPFISN